MGFLTAVKGLFGKGGLGGKILEFVGGRWPEKMSQEDKAKVQMAIAQASREFELEMLQRVAEEEERFNKRITDLEGTAKDLAGFGWLGKIVVFARGAQRPIWGFIVMVMDIQLYSGRWDLPDDPQMKQAFYVINFLVLGFLFGERAVKNILPLVSTYMGKSGR